jgi:hypothetical protein
MSTLKQKIVGHYSLGPESVQLVIREGVGGEFYANPGDGQCARIKVGVDEKSWTDVVCTLLHEAMEMAMTRIQCRYAPAPDYGQDHAGYLFAMNHPQFSEASARTGVFIAKALPDLSRAYTKWTRDSRRKRK